MEEEVEYQSDYKLIHDTSLEGLEKQVQTQLSKKDNVFETSGSPTCGNGVWVQALVAFDVE